MADQKVPTFNSTGGNISIIETVSPFEEIELQFVPDKIKWTGNLKSAPIEVPNTDVDFNHVTGSRETISFDAEFFSRDIEQAVEVTRRVKWLMSLQKLPKRTVIIDWGDMFDDRVWIAQRVTSNLSLFLSQSNYNPKKAIVSLEFVLDYSDSVNLTRMRD